MFLLLRGRQPQATSTFVSPDEAGETTNTGAATLSSEAGNQRRLARVPPQKNTHPDDDEQAHVLAECWARCGSPCTVDETGENVCPGECEHDDECESDELCMPTRTTASGQRFKRCLTDQCSGMGADSDCGPGMTCNHMSRLEGSIYMCTEAGRRKTGEACGHAEFDEIGLCEIGLHCLNGECSPLSCEDDNDCGDTARCFGFAGGMRQCVPFCEGDDDCPDGRVCNQEREIGHCVAPATMGCLHQGCPDADECVVHSSAPYLSVTSCLRSCEETTECGDHHACGNTEETLTPYCYQLCDDGHPPCGDGWICGDAGIVSLEDDSSPRTCVRDTARAVDEFFQGYEPQL